MGTIISTSGGFANLPVTAPAGWPANLTWPGGQSPNGANTMTMTDADFIKVLVWVANASNVGLVGAGPPPVAVTPAQLRLAWLTIWANGSVTAAQQLAVANAIAALTPPPPPAIAVT